MSTYRAFEAALNHPAKRWPKIILAVVILLGVSALSAGGIYLQKQANIQDVRNQPIVTNVANYSGGNQRINEQFFSLDLPGKWKEIYRDASKNQLVVEWQSTEIHRDARFLTVYIDKIPQDFGFNRLLPLTVVSNKLSPGPLSENCTSFTNKAPTTTGSGYINATWQNVSFLCDAARTERNLWGTGTVDNGLGAKVTGLKSGTHTYFFTYADNTSQVEPDRFAEIIKSFTAK